MAKRVIMPKQGNSVETVILLEWKKDEGDRVQEGETLCEVETDKATFEVPCPASGVLLQKLYGDGDDVPVMQPFAVVGESGETVPERSVGKDAANESRAMVDVARAEAAPIASRRSSSDPTQEAVIMGRRDVRISPLARSTAASLGVDESRYREIAGSGPGGRILRRDVEAFAADRGGRSGAYAGAGVAASGPSAAQESGSVQAGGATPVESVKVTGVRKVIAERMLSSLAQTAQLTLNASADATQLTAYRKKLKAAPESLGVSDITLNDLIMFIIARIVARHRALNAHYVPGQPDEIRRFGSVNLGFAVDDEKGLFVPVIRGADSLTLRALADRAHELASAVHTGEAGPDALRGATFTVTNLGAFGVRDFTPVLNPPEVGIIGVGGIRPEQTYRGDRVLTAPHIGLSLTFDHRATDGGPAARFLQDVAAAIANAETVLAL